MSDTAQSFIRGNVLSPVVRCNTTTRDGAWYVLADGNRYDLSKTQLTQLGEIMARTGFAIRHLNDPSK